VAAAHEAARIIDAQRKPVVLQSIFPESPSVRVLREAGVPVYRGIREAAVALAALRRERSPAELDPLELPDSATSIAETGYVAVRELLVAHGIEFPDLVVVRNEAELRTALTSGVPRFPLVLKAMGLQHKSDSGGVVLDLPDQESVLAAYRDLVGRLAPPAVAVESMADVSGAIEVIAGVHHDRRFGPVVMVGLGGVLTEVLSDVAFALAPASPETVEALLLSLRGAALFGGVRGRPRVDVTAAARLVSRLSAVAAAHPELDALEINPVLVGPAGAIALDARAVRIPDPVTRPGGTRSAPGALVTR
jgi:acyl-CoA synthetase (NDP forming)